MLRQWFYEIPVSYYISAVYMKTIRKLLNHIIGPVAIVTTTDQ